MPSKPTLDQIRDRLTAARAELDALPRAPLPRAEAVAAIARWVEAQAARFDARTAAAPFRGPSPGVAEALKLSALERGPHRAEVDLGPLLCNMLPSLVTDALAAGIPQDDDRTGPPTAARPAIQDRLEAEIRRLELQEELEIRAAESRGERPARRADADPAIVLAFDRELAV